MVIYVVSVLLLTVSHDASGIPLQATLENIREQEESLPPPAPAQGEPGESVLPPPEKRGAPAPKSPSIQSDAQGYDSSSLNLSADVSMDSGRAEASSPSHDADMLSLSADEEDAGEDQSCDLSSHGKYERSLARSLTRLLSCGATKLCTKCHKLSSARLLRLKFVMCPWVLSPKSFS